VSRYLDHLDRLFSPDLVVIGGGVSRRWEKYAGALDTRLEVVPAVLENEAGIVGAALFAAGPVPLADQATMN
jgi:polyphosphate glucokinase